MKDKQILKMMLVFKIFVPSKKILMIPNLPPFRGAGGL
jgi:hypothetical protein